MAATPVAGGFIGGLLTGLALGVTQNAMTPGNAARYQSGQVQGRDRYRYPPLVPVALQPEELKREDLARLNDWAAQKREWAAQLWQTYRDEQGVECKRLDATEVFCSHYLTGQLRDFDTDLFTAVAKRGASFAGFP